MSTFDVNLVTAHIFGVDLPVIAAAPVEDNPVSVLGVRLVAMYWAGWAGGKHPASLADRAQNGSVVDGGTVTTLSEWTGNSAHPTTGPGTIGAVWRENHVGGYDVFDLDDSFFSQSPAIVLGNNTTIYAVHESVAGRAGTLFEGSVASNPRAYLRTNNVIDIYDTGNNSIYNGIGGGLNQLVIHHDAVAPASKNFVDGRVVDEVASSNDYGAATLASFGSNAPGTSKVQTGVPGFFVLQNATMEDIAYLDRWVANQSSYIRPGTPIASWDFRDPSTLFSDVAKTTAAALDGSVAVICDKTGSYDWVQATGSKQGSRMVGGVYTDGVDDYYISNALSAACVGGYTIGFSFVYEGDSNCLWSFHDPSGTNRGMLWTSSGKVRWYYNTTSSSNTGATSLYTGRRYTVIVTVSAGGDAIIYLNGVAEITVTAGATVLPVDPGQFSLAQEWDSASPSNEYNALYRRGEVYDTVLSGADITSLHNWLGVP